MRILFLESSSIWPFTLPQAFLELGHDVLISGPLTKTNIAEMIHGFAPDFAVSIGWGEENIEEKPHWIRNAVKNEEIPLVYWAIEDPAFTEIFSLPLIEKMKPDFIFSLCPLTVKRYESKGFKAEHLDFGFSPLIHRAVPPQKKHNSYSITVVANAYPHILETYPTHYRRIAINTLITPLLQEDIRVDFWGEDWDKMAIFGLNIPEAWIHGPISYEHANQIYSSSAIVLGLQNYQHIVTQRTYEILGSAGFLITLDTPAVRCLSSDIVTSASPLQTLQLVEYYIRNPEQRNIIRHNGQKAVAPHTYRNRAEYMLKVLRDYTII